ncbi:hypothetical protein [Thermococcus sp.]|uniref:hypothetical protein n=1 Tax=Thermococcus sp. TaxID=35749 RepID=UPI00262B7486|nr:hypothetical protein [Thermococcus sp.]
MRKPAVVVLVVGLVALIGLGVKYFINHYGNINYEWKTNLEDYREYNLLGNSTLSGYIKANRNVSVYVLTKEDFRRLKEGKPFGYYLAWEHVREVKLDNVRIPEGDYLLVVKNDEKGMQWISVKLMDRK